MYAIYYTVCSSNDPDKNALYLTELRASIESLRTVNSDIRVHVFIFGISRRAVEAMLGSFDVQIIEKPTYCRALEIYCGERAAVLCEYPVLARWLALRDFKESEVQSLLYLDTDTHFVSDPIALFAHHASQDWYAREEPFSSSSHLGYDPQYIDESVLGLHFELRGGQPLCPMNLGVLLMNHRVWERIEDTLGEFVDVIWSFLVWLAYVEPPQAISDSRMSLLLMEVRATATETDRANALRYPSSNSWIVDALSMLLVIGRLKQFTVGLLNRSLALQGYEFAASDLSALRTQGAVLSHYFSKNYLKFMQWQQGNRYDQWS